MKLIAEILGGLIAYAALIAFACRFMAFGMGTLPPKEQKRIVLAAFDGERV